MYGPFVAPSHLKSSAERRIYEITQKPYIGDLPSPVSLTRVTALARIALKLNH